MKIFESSVWAAFRHVRFWKERVLLPGFLWRAGEATVRSNLPLHMNLRALSLVLVVFLGVFQVHAADYTWNHDQEEGPNQNKIPYEDPANWLVDGVPPLTPPGASDNIVGDTFLNGRAAFFGDATIGNIIWNTNTNIRLLVEPASDPYTFTVNGDIVKNAGNAIIITTQGADSSDPSTMKLSLNVLGNITLNANALTLTNLLTVTVAGTTTITSGDLSVVSPSADFGVINLTGAGSSFRVFQAAGTGGATVAGVTGTTGVVQTSQNNNLSSTGTVTINTAGSNSYTYTGTVRDGAGTGTKVLNLVKNGTGTQVLGGNNTFSGSVTVNDGTLRITNGSATTSGLGFGTAMVMGATVGGATVSGGTLDLSGNILINKAITLDGGALINDMAATTATLNDGLAGVQFTDAGANYFLSGSGTNNGTLTISGGGGSGATGIITRQNTAQTAILTVTLQNGGSGYTDAGSITLTPVGNNPSGSGFVGTALLSSLTLNGTSNTMGGEGNLTVAAAVGGSGGFTKTGAGIQTLSSPIGNTYAGGTEIEEGMLLVFNTIGSALGAGDVTVDGGTLGGTGFVTLSGGNAISVAAGAALMGGDGILASGSLAIDNDVTLADGSLIRLALGAGGAHSTLARAGGNWTFDLDQIFSFINDNAEVGTYADIITGLATDPGVSNWTVANMNWEGTFSYDAGNVSFNLTAIPEPSVWMLAVWGGAFLIARRRRGGMTYGWLHAKR